MWGPDAGTPTDKVWGRVHEYVWALRRKAGPQAGMAHAQRTRHRGLWIVQGSGSGDMCVCRGVMLRENVTGKE